MHDGMRDPRARLDLDMTHHQIISPLAEGSGIDRSEDHVAGVAQT